MEKSFINRNLIKLLEKFGFEKDKDGVKFIILDDSCFGRILNNQKVKGFLEKEDVKWRELLNKKESETPAFADLARLSEVNVYSGVRDWTRYFKNYTSGDLKYLNHNGSVPTEYITIASASKYSKNLNFRFGESGLFFKPTCSLLFGKQDFDSCGVGAALDPRMAFQNYNEKKFNRKNLAFDLNGIAKKLQYDFYLHSTDLHLENTRNKYVNEKNQIINRFKSFFSPHQRERKLNRDIAKSKGFASKGFAMLYGKETEYSEMHLPATILLAEGVFSLDCLTENSLKQYEVICNLKEFLSSNDENITESQLNIFKRLLAKDLLESNGLELLKSKFLEIRRDFLENTAKYFQDITASHQIRVEELIEDDKMEDAIALALQSDYFQKFTTTAGIQQHLKNPLNIKIFNSKTNEVENILQEEVLPLIKKIDLVKKIIEDDKVKATDRESLKKIFNKVDLRKIIEYFTKDGETSFPEGAIDNDKLNLEKLLKIDNLQEFFKPFFDDCDQKLDNIKQNEMKFFLAPFFLVGIACLVLSTIPTPAALLFLIVGVEFCVGSVLITLVDKVVCSLIAQEQLKELKEGRPEINKKQAFAKIVGRCCKSFTSYFIKQQSQPATPFIGTEQQSPPVTSFIVNEQQLPPATPLEPATIGAPATSLWLATIGAVAKESTEMSI